ncbi:MAG: GNAT family N-acetyltransferase [Chloroflexota bacterium]|nr:GNAT family N-acetyltransferase [Chloroflexota bacterium]
MVAHGAIHPDDPNLVVACHLPNFAKEHVLNERHQALIEEYDPQIDLHRGAVYAIVQDGRIVSTCESSRENETADEAWVRTLPEYRRHGYARQVTEAWAHNLQQQDQIPFYSHRRDKLASQGVARRLQLIQYMDFVAYS